MNELYTQRSSVWYTFGHDGGHEFSVGFFSCQKGQTLQGQLCQLRAPPAKQNHFQTTVSVKKQEQDSVEGGGVP